MDANLLQSLRELQCALRAVQEIGQRITERLEGNPQFSSTPCESPNRAPAGQVFPRTTATSRKINYLKNQFIIIIIILFI
jgi:hypothetical protein